jgi:hypothetical protein
MYRVTAVSEVICNAVQNVHKNDVMTACLLHDMGNILKFNMDLFPSFFEPEGIAYWQGVKEDFRKKYGENEHIATLSIIKELGVSPRIYELVDAFSFSKAKENYESQDIDRMICTYADMRVAPHGVVSLEERLADGRKRFKLNNPRYDREGVFVEMAGYLGKMEQRIFENSILEPSSITEERIAEATEKLRNFVIV